MAPKPRKDLSVLFLSDEYQQIGNGTVFLTVRQGDLFSKRTLIAKRCESRKKYLTCYAPMRDDPHAVAVSHCAVDDAVTESRDRSHAERCKMHQRRVARERTVRAGWSGYPTRPPRLPQV
jgi:hypothetical protein